MEQRLKRIWADDDATDNSQLNYFAQCKDCIYSGNSSPQDNEYTKLHCQMYKKPAIKPSEVRRNIGDCPHRKTKETNKDEASNQPDHSEIKNTIDGLKKKYDL